MTYIGQQPSTTFDSGIQDRFTGLTTNTVTLTHDISAETDILVVWNNIVQDSGSYSVGGAGNKTLTLGGSLVSADVVTVYYTNKVMQSVSPTAGSVQTLSINDGAVTNAKLANSSITLNGSAVSLGGSATVGGDNTPMFSVRQTGTVNVSDNTYTKVAWNSELVDTDNAFASDKFTVPSGKSGKYFLYTMILGQGASDNTLRVYYLNIYKNGSRIAMNEGDYRSSTIRKATQTVTTVQDLSEGDYIEVYVGIDVNSSIQASYSGGDYQGMFGGYKLIT